MRRAIHDAVACVCGRSGFLGTQFGNHRSSGLSWHWLYHRDSGCLRLLYNVCYIIWACLCI